MSEINDKPQYKVTIKFKNCGEIYIFYTHYDIRDNIAKWIKFNGTIVGPDAMFLDINCNYHYINLEEVLFIRSEEVKNED